MPKLYEDEKSPLPEDPMAEGSLADTSAYLKRKGITQERMLRGYQTTSPEELPPEGEVGLKKDKVFPI